jgi:hypothetical protein
VTEEELVLRELITIELKDVLMVHMRDGIGECCCGTAKLGTSFSNHVIAVWRAQWLSRTEDEEQP